MPDDVTPEAPVTEADLLAIYLEGRDDIPNRDSILFAHRQAVAEAVARDREALAAKVAGRKDGEGGRGPEPQSYGMPTKPLPSQRRYITDHEWEAMRDRAERAEAALAATPSPAPTAPLDVEALDRALAAIGVHVQARTGDPTRPESCRQCAPTLKKIAAEYAPLATPDQRHG